MQTTLHDTWATTKKDDLHTAFSKLPRATREKAYQKARATKGRDSIISVADLMNAYGQP